MDGFLVQAALTVQSTHIMHNFFNDRQNAQVERQVSLLQMSLSWPASLLMRMLFQVLNQLRR